MVVPEVNRPLLKKLHDRFIEGQNEMRGEWSVLNKHGEERRILADAALIEGQDGRPKKVTFVVDITESKRTEERARLMALFAELAPEPILRFNPAGEVIMANPVSYEVLQRGELAGKCLRGLVPELAKLDFSSIIAKGQLHSSTAQLGERTYRLTIRGVPDLGFGQLYATDVTPTLRALEKAEQASISKSQFLANMSHELRTPLSAINGFSEVLLENIVGDLNGQQREYISRISQSGHHLLALINDLLDLAKIEAGRMELIYEERDLRATCHEACDLITARAQSQGLELWRQLPDEPVRITADHLRLRQVLINLLSNAVKFTRRGGVTVWLEPGENEIRFGVKDTGSGISEEGQQRLFQRFEQVHDPRTSIEMGTGLGLSLCKEIVASHGGTISVESEVGRGSNFTVMLPVSNDN